MKLESFKQIPKKEIKFPLPLFLLWLSPLSARVKTKIKRPTGFKISEKDKDIYRLAKKNDFQINNATHEIYCPNGKVIYYESQEEGNRILNFLRSLVPW